MKYRFLLIIAMTNFALQTMEKREPEKNSPRFVRTLKSLLARNNDKGKTEFMRVEDPTSTLAEYQSSKNEESMRILKERENSAFEEVKESLGITQDEIERETLVLWRDPEAAHAESADNVEEPIIYKKVEKLRKETVPFPHQIGHYPEYYINCIQWWWLHKLVFLRLPYLEKKTDFITISIPLVEYLDWKGFYGVQSGQNALEELPKITQKVSDAYSRQVGFKRIFPFIAASISIVAGIKLLMSKDSTNMCIGGTAIGAGLWQWYHYYTKK
jgi:hypothetical protein